MTYMNKIKQINELPEILTSLKKDNKKIILCHGVFDLLHVGHIRYLNQAKSFGDTLVVTVTPDHFVNKGPHRPAFTDKLRAENIAAMDCVDFVAVNNWPTAVETIQLLKPDYYVKGSEYKDAANDVTGKIKDEAEAVKSVGGEIRFTEDITFSSSHLINSSLSLFDDETNAYLEKFRHSYDLQQVTDAIDSLKDLNVLVIGEAIIDEYVYCESLGKSGKEPVLVMKYNKSEKYAGGSLAIANHIAKFCDKVSIATYLGAENSEEELIRGSLEKNVEPFFIYKSDSPTIVKKRFVESYSLTKMLGVYDLNTDELKESEEDELIQYLEKSIQSYDVVIIADYDHGLFTPRIIDYVQNHAKFLAVNTQVNAANIGFHAISKYSNANYICIQEGEIRMDRRNRHGEIHDLIAELADRLGDPSIMITRGSKGTIYYESGKGFTECPAFAVKIVDRVGAGDAVLSLSSLLSANGTKPAIIGLISNLVGADAVTIVGNKRSINRVNLLKSINSIMK